MKETTQIRIRKATEAAPALAAIFVAAMALLVLLGWTFNVELLKSLLHPQRVAMNPLTAVAFLLAATGLWVARRDPPSRAGAILLRICALIILFIALARLTSYWFAWSLHLDRLLFRSRLVNNEMAPNTALAFGLVAVAMLTLDVRTRWGFHPAQILMIVAGSIGLLSIVGYLYSTLELYSVSGFIPMALNTAINFTVLAGGFLCARSDREPIATFTSNTQGGSIARRLVPAAIFVPLLLGLLEYKAERLGLFDRSFGLPLLVVSNILIFNLLIWWCARVMHKADVRRHIAEDVIRNSEERNRAIMEQSAEGIFLLDLETKRIIDANPALERLLGYSHGEVRNLKIYDLVHAPPATIDSRLQQMAETDAPLHGERRYRRKDGSTVEVEASAGVISYGGRRVVCSAVHDITERKHAEATLAAERNLLRTLIDNIPDSIFIKDANGRYITCNIAHARFAGVSSPDKIAGKTVFDLHPPNIAEFYNTADRAILDAGKPMLSHEEFITDSKGQRQWALVSKIPVFNAMGAVSGMVGITRDVTLQKQAEEALAAERNLLRTVIDNLPDRIYVKDTHGKYLLDNIAHQKQIGISDFKQIVGKTTRDFFPPEIAEKYEKDDQNVLQSGKPLLEREESFGDKDGNQRWLLTTKVPLTDGRKHVVGLVGLSRDITERKQADERLRASEARATLIIETANDAFVAMDARGKIISWNPQAEQTFGWKIDEAAGRSLAQTIIPERYREAHAKGLAHFMSTGEGPVLGQRLELSAIHRDGHEFPIEITISPARLGDEQIFFAFIHDITARKRAEKELQEAMRSEQEAHQNLKATQSQLVQSEKLAGLGQMVAGVAHEINNPLSFVSNNVAVLQRDIRGLESLLALYAQADPLISEKNAELTSQIRDLSERMDLAYTQKNMREILDRSREGLRRIQQIVKDLRDFARLDESDLHEVDLNAGIESTVNIVKGKAKKKRVEIVHELAPLPPVAVFPAKINQVVMNLVSNAIDACPEGGKVIVRTACEDKDVRITVSDNGPGVPQAIRGRIFDPFFTTKPIGEGTGLGLSISYGIVHDHGGTIEITDAPGGGAVFTVTLPRRCAPKK